MKVLVVGSGGREHAIVKKLAESPLVSELYALPGNGGMEKQATCVPISATDIDKIAEFAVENKIEFAVVAPDNPLVMGAVDALHEKGIKCFGPTAAAAIIEGSKVFSKNLMQKYNIPTAGYHVFETPSDALHHINNCTFPIVIKADGLALGKGVIIAESILEAINAINNIMNDKIFGESGNKIVVEEFLKGPEVSVLCFTDGKTVVPMVSSMDHKRALDGDNGLNTGGMGTVAPNPYYTQEIADTCMETIFIPTINAMNSEGRTFKGCLYFGLMITKDGPKVIEYNCRFGDPETQVVLPLLKTDLLEIMLAVEEERLDEIKVEFDGGHACCVVLASNGYPQNYKTGYAINFADTDDMEDVYVYHAGTKIKDGELVTAGGRVLGVTATGKTLNEAVELAYVAANKIKFDGVYCRRDIGKRALDAYASKG